MCECNDCLGVFNEEELDENGLCENCAENLDEISENNMKSFTEKEAITLVEGFDEKSIYNIELGEGFEILFSIAYELGKQSNNKS